MEGQYGFSVKNKRGHFGKIDEFVIESRERQTKFFLLEGCNHPMSLNNNSKSFLLRYLLGSIYYTKFVQDNLSQEEKNFVNQLVDKILLVGQSSVNHYNFEFSVIEVYCYNYENQSMMTTVLFKVARSESSAAYINVESHVFSDWDEFLDNPHLGHAFICIPQNGKYEKENEVLQLNYFVAGRNYLRCDSNSRLALTSFSQESFNNETKSVISNFKEKIMAFCSTIWSGLKAYAKAVILFSIKLFVGYLNYKEETTSALEVTRSLAECGFRLFCNQKKEISGFNSGLSLSSISWENVSCHIINFWNKLRGFCSSMYKCWIEPTLINFKKLGISFLKILIPILKFSSFSLCYLGPEYITIQFFLDLMAKGIEFGDTIFAEKEEIPELLTTDIISSKISEKIAPMINSSEYCEKPKNVYASAVENVKSQEIISVMNDLWANGNQGKPWDEILGKHDKLRYQKRLLKENADFHLFDTDAKLGVCVFFITTNSITKIGKALIQLIGKDFLLEHAIDGMIYKILTVRNENIGIIANLSPLISFACIKESAIDIHN